MHRSHTFLIVLLLLFAVLLSACSSTTKLNGTDWQLVELNGQKLPAHIQITLGFQEDQAGGKAPCNNYGASYTQKGSKLIFDQANTTLMYCDGVMDYETDYFAAFSVVKSFRLENDVLSLLDESSTVVLVFGKP